MCTFIRAQHQLMHIFQYMIPSRYLWLHLTDPVWQHQLQQFAFEFNRPEVGESPWRRFGHAVSAEFEGFSNVKTRKQHGKTPWWTCSPILGRVNSKAHCFTSQTQQSLLIGSGHSSQYSAVYSSQYKVYIRWFSRFLSLYVILGNQRKPKGKSPLPATLATPK